jgi:cysteinyl-tRNA synthetase
MYGLYQVTKMIPALLSSTFELSLENDELKTEQALDIIDSWLFQFKVYQNMHATRLPLLLKETQTGTTICSILASPQDEIFSDIPEKQHMSLSEVFALLNNMIERYKHALAESSVPSCDTLRDELIYTTTDVARMYAIYQHNVKNKLYSLFRENSTTPRT